MELESILGLIPVPNRLEAGVHIHPDLDFDIIYIDIFSFQML